MYYKSEFYMPVQLENTQQKGKNFQVSAGQFVAVREV